MSSNNQVRVAASGPGDSQAYQSLRDYTRAARFKESEALRLVDRELDHCSRQRLTEIVFTHSPYPEEGDDETIGEPSRRGFASGQGCGKSEFLISVAERLSKRSDCTVVEFLDNRKTLADGSNFFTDVFLERLAHANPRLLGSTWGILRSVPTLITRLLQRIGLLLNLAIPLLVAAVTPVVALLGLKIFDFLSDPRNDSFLKQTAVYVDNNTAWILPLVALLFVLWLLNAWEALHQNEKLWQRWQELSLRTKGDDRLSDVKEQLMHDPVRVLRQLTRRGRSLALLIDDIDMLDGRSFRAILDIHECAQRSKTYSLLMLLTCNPRNPSLHRVEKAALLNEIQAVQVGDQEWKTIALEPPKSQQMRSWLLGYYGESRVLDLLNLLERDFAEACYDTGLVLSFFIDFDRRVLANTRTFAHVQEDDFRREFEKYLHRDQRLVGDIVEAITKTGSDGETSLEILKYILAFRHPQVRLEHLKRVLQGKPLLNQLPACERILLSDSLDLLRRANIDGHETYAFRQPYLRSILDAGWKDWQEGSQSYYSEVFLGLNRIQSVKEDPELALEASPSKLAIDVLFRQGEYLYRYYGASDVGSALKYYGIERGGACGKWFRLMESAIENNEVSWDLIEWTSNARINPFRNLRGSKSYPAQTFIPNLILTTGRLYWMIGKWETARHIWEVRWPAILEHLPPAPSQELAHRFSQADTDIRSALAEMFYEVGQRSCWEEADGLCSGLQHSRAPNVALPHWARAIATLMRHYRAVGVGNYLPPYRFLRPDVSLSSLRSSADAIPATDPSRLHILYAFSNALWQSLTTSTLAPPAHIELSDLHTLKVDDALLAAFLDACAELGGSLAVVIDQTRSKNKNVLTTDRRLDGDLFYWEGILAIVQARCFLLRAYLELSKYALLFKDDKRSRQKQRFDTCYVTSYRLRDMVLGAPLVSDPTAEFANTLADFDELSNKRRADDGAALTSLDERRARRLTEKLYEEGWKGMIFQAREKLRLADALYRRLGFGQGLTAVSFAEAILSCEFSSREDNAKTNARIRSAVPALGQASVLRSFDESPEWVDLFDRFFQRTRGELGYHMETLVGHLLVARWAKEFDLYRSIKEFQHATSWTASDVLRLPRAFDGEICFQIGCLIGNMEAAPFTEDYTLDIFDRSAKVMDTIEEKPPYVAADEITSRRLDIHWWLAEIMRRKASAEPDPLARSKHLERVVAECGYIINRTRGVSERAQQEAMAKLVRGEALADQGKLEEGFKEIELAESYFDQTKNDYLLLQACTHLVRMAWYGDAHTKNWKKCQEQCQTKYFPSLMSTASGFVPKLGDLNSTEKTIFCRAGTLIGEVLLHFSTPDHHKEATEEAIRWFGTVFSVLTSLGLFGTAILLDNELRPAYERIGDSAGLAVHKQRVIAAAQRLDPDREQINFSQIGSIIRHYTELLYSDSSQAKDKRECMKNAQRALSLPHPELESALSLLERGCGFIASDDYEYLDIDLLQLMIVVNYRKGDTDKAVETEKRLARIKSSIQSRDFFAIAEHYKATGADCVWALRIAASADPPNQYSALATAELSTLGVEVTEEPPVPEQSKDPEYNKQALIEKSSHEFSVADCYMLMRWLEQDLRSLIVDELSRLTPQWWKQRVPPDTRTKTEERKAQNEQPDLGRVTRNLPLHEYLDFSDYSKVITMKLNWDDAFKAVFHRQDIVSVKLGDIQSYRNDIAHMRELHPQDREMFVAAARQMIRVISTRNAAPAGTEDSTPDTQES